MKSQPTDYISFLFINLDKIKFIIYKIFINWVLGAYKLLCQEYCCRSRLSCRSACDLYDHI